MSQNSPESFLNTLRGRIWLAAGALAIFNCVLGLLAYLVASFLTAEPFYIVLFTFFLTTSAILIFGWWQSNEVLRPIENVSLLAKSLERSPNASLPKTTGAAETDQLLDTLHRNSRQLQNLIGMMDDVAAGKTDTALTPLQNSDKLSASFQKLVSKVTDSIDAKKELIAIETAVMRLTNEVAPVRDGILDVEITTDLPHVSDISEVLASLVQRLNDLTRTVQANSTDAKLSAIQVQRAFRTAIETSEKEAVKLGRVATAVKESSGHVHRFCDDLSNSVARAVHYVGGPAERTPAETDGANAFEPLRKQVGEAVKRVHKLRERSHTMPQVAKTAEDLSRRSNLIALNTSLQGPDAPSTAGAISLLSEEMASLSVRAESVNKEISSINESLLREVADIEAALDALASEVADASRNAAQRTQALSGLDKCLAHLSEIPAKLNSFASEQTMQHEQTLRLIGPSYSEFSGDASPLRNAENDVAKLIQTAESLQQAVADLRPAQTETRERVRSLGDSMRDELRGFADPIINNDPSTVHQEN